MKSTLSFFLIAIFIITSCGEQKKNTKDQLYDKVMAVHDEIMPKMGDIMKYKKQLKAKIAELVVAGQEENEAKIAELTKAVDDLENSHEEMMNWMREFDNDFDGMVQEQVMAYLKDQMTKIENVGKATYTAIKNAQELLAD